MKAISKTNKINPFEALLVLQNTQKDTQKRKSKVEFGDLEELSNKSSREKLEARKSKPKLKINNLT